MQQTLPETELADRIEALTDNEAKQVVFALTAILKRRAETKYAGDDAALSVIKGSMGSGEVQEVLEEVSEGTPVETDAKTALLAFASVPEFGTDLRSALQQAQFKALSGYEPWLIAAAITFALSLQFRLKAGSKGGKRNWSFEVGKEATALSFIQRLLGLGGDKTEDKKAAGARPKA